MHQPMLRGSISIGRILGIPVYLHITFVLLLALLLGLSFSAGGPSERVFHGFLFLISMFTCVLAHEFGHALMARRFGVKTLDITLLPIGGVARLQRMPEHPTEELLIALAGPAVNVVIALGLGTVLTLSGSLDWSALPGFLKSPETQPLHLPTQVLVGNVLLLLFNLVPAFPMDGGRVLRALLTYTMPHTLATQAAAKVGQGLAVLTVLGVLFTTDIGFVSQNYMLLVIAIFVWFGARGEALQVRARARLNPLRVEDALLTELRALPSSARLGQALHLLQHSSQRAIPVLDDSGFHGVAGAGAILQAVQRLGLEASILQATQRDLLHVASDQGLNAALNSMQEAQQEMAVVVKDGRFAGMLDAEHANRVLTVQDAATAAARSNEDVKVRKDAEYIFPPLR